MSGSIRGRAAHAAVVVALTASTHSGEASASAGVARYDGSTIPNVIMLCHQGEVRDAAAWRHALLAARPRAEAMCPDLIVELQGEQAGVLQRLHCVGGRKARACVHERAALVAGLSNSRSAVVTYTHRLCVCEP